MGYRKGQKLLHSTERGMRIVTFERETETGAHDGMVIYVRECVDYLERHELYSLEYIQGMFDGYAAADARRWRAIDDGITPCAMLSNEELDAIIDENKEWCEEYEKMLAEE